MTNTTHMIDSLEMAAHHDWALLTVITEWACREEEFILDPCDYRDLRLDATDELAAETVKIQEGYRS